MKNTITYKKYNHFKKSAPSGESFIKTILFYFYSIVKNTIIYKKYNHFKKSEPSGESFIKNLINIIISSIYKKSNNLLKI